MSLKASIIHPLYFEGIRLPDFAAFLDIAATMAPVSEETSMWFWRFPICIGAGRKERAKIVQAHSKELIEALASVAGGLSSEIAAKFPGYASERVVSDWFTSLKTITEIAQSRKVCQWHMEEGSLIVQPEATVAWTELAMPTPATS
jgi:hypothetical protein